MQYQISGIHINIGDALQNYVKDELNEAIDIPFVGESKEGKVFKTLIKIITKTVKKYEDVLTGVKKDQKTS